MGIKTIEFFEVGDRYTEDGSGPFQVIARFWDEAVASRYAEKRGNYGSDAKVKPASIVIADTAQDMNDYHQKELAQKALDKLSYEEKVALGLTEK